MKDRVDSTEYYFNYYLSNASPEEVAFINEISNTLSDSSLWTDSTEFDQEIIDLLSSIETDILNSGLDSIQIRMPLLYVAVAKHSAAYWSSLYGQSFKPLSSSLSKKTLMWGPRYFAAKHPIVQGDAKGAVAGAISGAVAGAIFGPTAIIGAGYGAVTGGIGTSVFMALEG